MTALLSFRGVRVERGGETLLEVAEWDLAAGEVAVVSGPTGAGKTLLAAVCAGLAELSAGAIRLGAVELRGAPAARRRAGLAATVSDGQRVAGVSVEEALRLAGRRRAAEALQRFPLLKRRRSVRAELLSGGEQQLLQVVCAWSAQPAVLVLDAPTLGLADDLAATVVALGEESATAGAAVLWLDQPGAATPNAPRWWLERGRLSQAPGVG